MRQRRPAKLIARAAALCAAALLLVLPAAQPASAATDPNDPETPVVNSGDYTPSPGNTISHTPGGPVQGDNSAPVTLHGSWCSTSLGTMVPCGGGSTPGAGSSGYSCSPVCVPVQQSQQTPTTAPSTPSAPTLATPSVAVSCTQSGWEAEWNEWASTSTTEYSAQWEARWRVDSEPVGVWRTKTPTIAGTAAVVSGGPEPDETVEVRVRGRAQRRHGNSVGWSGWSPWSGWTSWRSATDPCPTRPFPTPTVTACRSAGGVEVSWAAPPGLLWRVGTGWAMDVHRVDAQGQPTAYLSAYSRDANNLIPWADRHVTLGVPAGTRVLIGVLAYAPARYGPLAQDTAEATPEAGCGPPAPPPRPPTPPVPAASAPTGASLACVDDGSGGVEATAIWAGRADTVTWTEEYQVEWSIDRSGTVTTLLRPVWPHYANGPPTRIGPAQGIAGADVITMRVRARASQRAIATNAHGTSRSRWTSFGAWSSWSAASAPATCPVPVAPPPPLLPVCSVEDEPYTDANGNGRWDAGESWTDLNRDGSWTANLTLHAALYPAGHYEPWTDTNDNGAYDAGDPFTDTNGNGWRDSDEHYTDANGNGQYDPGEGYSDLNGNGRWDPDISGQPTGDCYPLTIGIPPRPHPCLQPGNVCIAMGS